MADKRIGELTVAESLDDASLIPMEQNGRAMALPGSVLRQLVSGGGTSEGAAVLYTAQTLTATQQQQARQNIGAVSTADFTAALGEVNAALAGMDEVIG